MSWNLDSSRPIYAQIIEKISLDIISGRYQPGEKLPSVRDLAAQAGVNPNTMQKALAGLERDELVYSVRTSGRFITEDKEMIEKMKENLASEQIKYFLEKMADMGFDYEMTLALLDKFRKEREK
ncbi:MAG: GntR family transcriptional regulator [Eubacterium sp.]|nr:GntR family transcriptional regulator [Eubacterium sp.]MDD7209839.1 GntR family transcriptional regulator [Lachnospiraceae bacterium]MDY5497230.1 GntR family transcriptional regulator [Anaerobutyricum sp.]